MKTSRRSFLLGSVSLFALTGAGGVLAVKGMSRAQNLPEGLYEPGIEAMTAAVRCITDLLKPSLIAFDATDLRAMLKHGGRAVHGEGSAAGHDRARFAAETALANLRIITSRPE